MPKYKHLHHFCFSGMLPFGIQHGILLYLLVSKTRGRFWSYPLSMVASSFLYMQPFLFFLLTVHCICSIHTCIVTEIRTKSMSVNAIDELLCKSNKGSSRIVNIIKSIHSTFLPGLSKVYFENVDFERPHMKTQINNQHF